MSSRMIGTKEAESPKGVEFVGRVFEREDAECILRLRGGDVSCRDGGVALVTLEGDVFDGDHGLGCGVRTGQADVE